jgi:hypothetical protein
MGAVKAGIAVKFKNTDGKGNSWKMWGARNEAFTQEGSWDTRITLA